MAFKSVIQDVQKVGWKKEKKWNEMINFPLEVKKWAFIYDAGVYRDFEEQIYCRNRFVSTVYQRLRFFYDGLKIVWRSYYLHITHWYFTKK